MKSYCKSWKGIFRVEVIAIVLNMVLLNSVPFTAFADSTQIDLIKEEAAKIEKNLHAVTLAAKKYLDKTGVEADSVDVLKKAGFLSKNHDDNAQIVENDSFLQVWGDGTGAYVMWNPEVSQDVCKKLNPGGTLPGDHSRKPDPSKGFQCVNFGMGRFYILEPVYIHK